MSLTRDQILSAADVRSESVSVPEWGGDVRVKVLSGTERDALETLLRDRAKLGQLGENMRATMVAACAVDDAGAPLFTLADVSALGAKSAIALDRVAAAALRINRMRDGDLEDAAKN